MFLCCTTVQTLILMKSYSLYLALKSDTNAGNKVSCPLCGYSELKSKDNSVAFFYCKNESCRKWTCLVWNQSFSYPKDIKNMTEEEKQEVQRDDGLNSHLNCAEYKKYVTEIADIWEKQAQRFWPKCGKGGRKNLQCTHIKCNRCSHEFCYFWGVSFNKVDKEDPKGNKNEHNHDWRRNDKRCPLFLNLIHNIDNRWPKGDAECQDYFHKMLVYKKNLENTLKRLARRHSLQFSKDLKYFTAMELILTSCLK